LKNVGGETEVSPFVLVCAIMWCLVQMVSDFKLQHLALSTERRACVARDLVMRCSHVLSFCGGWLEIQSIPAACILFYFYFFVFYNKWVTWQENKIRRILDFNMIWMGLLISSWLGVIWKIKCVCCALMACSRNLLTATSNPLCFELHAML